MLAMICGDTNLKFRKIATANGDRSFAATALCRVAHP